MIFDTEWGHREIAEEIARAEKKNGVTMRMTSPEKLILENQMQIMMALSLIMAEKKETPAALALSKQVSVTSVVVHGAKTWPE